MSLGFAAESPDRGNLFISSHERRLPAPVVAPLQAGKQ